MCPTPIANLIPVPDGHTMKWKEFQFTFYYLPGQTLYHDALLVENKNGEGMFFIGDSFSPTGMDDYCLQNRNFIHEGKGYLYCLDLLRRMPGNYWLVNQHIRQPFRFSARQLDFMERQLTQRRSMLIQLFPWDDPNYGLDQRWARVYPYFRNTVTGKSFEINIVVMNHSGIVNDFEIRPHIPGNGFSISPDYQILKVEAGQEAKARFTVQVSEQARPGIRIISADIGFQEWHLHHWCEGMIEVDQ